MPIPTWLSSFIGFGWIRDLLGIRKDLIDTKKSKLEVQKLEDEQRARNLITPATLDDVKEYDPKTRKLVNKISRIIMIIILLLLLMLATAILIELPEIPTR